MGDQPVEEDFGLRPPSAERVARRALALAAVAARSSAEEHAGDPVAERLREDVLEWTAWIGLAEEIEPREDALLRAPLGTLARQAVVDAGWRIEGLAVLGWALGRCDLPPHDEQADGPDIGSALGFLEDGPSNVLSGPRVGPREELRTLSDTLLSLHWRLRRYSLDGVRIDFAEAARLPGSFLRLDDLRLCEGDLELRGLPISRAPETLWREALSIARERQQAVNWLEGQGPIYSAVTCDT